MLLSQIVLLGALIAAVAAFAAGFFFSGQITRPIFSMTNAAKNLAKGDFSKKLVVQNNDELGELAQALNNMGNDLRSKIENLKRADKVKTDFVANVSHEIKTPLTLIRGLVETLEDGALYEKEIAKKFLKTIKIKSDYPFLI